MDKEFFDLIVSESKRIISNINENLAKNNGYFEMWGKIYNLRDPNYEIHYSKITPESDLTKTGVLYVSHKRFDNFSSFPEIPNIARLNFDGCIIRSFDGIRINPTINLLEVRSSKVYSLKGLNKHQIIVLLCDFEHESDLKKLLKNLPRKEKKIIKKAHKILFSYPEKIRGHKVYGFFDNFDNRYDLIPKIEANEEFSDLNYFIIHT